MIVVADSSPLITLARAHRFDLLHEFYAEVIVSREVHDEVIVAGAGLPGAKEVQEADWIRVYPGPLESSAELKASCVGLGIGERSIIYLAGARRVAKRVGLSIAGSIAVLEGGTKLGRVTDLRSVYLDLLDQGIRYDRQLLDQSLVRLGLVTLKS